MLFALFAALLSLSAFAAPPQPLFKAYAADYMHSSPSRGRPAHTLTALKMRAAVNEFETGSFVVHALGGISSLSVRIGDFTGRATGRKLRKPEIQLRVLDYAWLDRKRTREVPFVLREAAPAAMDRGQNRQYFLTVRSRDPADTGFFDAGITVTAGKTREHLSVSLYIYPFRLVDTSGIIAGAFLGSLKAMDRGSTAGLKAHGIDAVQFFWNGGTDLKIRNVKGRPVLEFNYLDSLLSWMKQAGMRGPVVPSMGNARTAHLERDLCRVFPRFKLRQEKRRLGVVKAGPLNDPGFDSLIIDVLAQARSRIESYGFEMVLIIYDEPTLFPLFEEFKARHTLIKSRLPGLRTYGVVMDSLEIAKRMAPYCEIISANDDFSRIREFTRKKKLGAYFYCTNSASFQAGEARGRMGFRFVSLWPDAVWFWAYNYYDGDPYVLHDGRGPETGQAVVFPPSSYSGGKYLETPAFEGIREACDDLRYAATLKAMLETSSSKTAYKIRREFTGMFDKIPAGLCEQIPCRDYAMFDSTRAVLAGWIQDLLREGQ